jgi:hypothetical protein
MIRQTGGLAVGAISTRSSSASRLSPASRETIPSYAFFTNRQFQESDFRVDSLMLVEGYCLVSS